MTTAADALSATCLGEARATLGEAPVWDARRGCLWWIDGAGRALHRHLPDGEPTDPLSLDETCAAIGLRAGGGLIAAMASGLALLDPDTGATERVARPEAARPDYRFNDAKCGPDGRFWVGSRHRDYTRPQGRLYRYAAGGGAAAVLDRLTVPNGLGWSPDARTFYLGDSPTGTITAFAFDPADGALGPGRPLTAPGDAPGWPDGLAVDAEGFLWNARWDGGCIVRFAPDGRVDRTVPLPVSRPTSCAFGGPALDRLYVTSARIGLDAATLAGQPLAGGLFVLDAGVTGAPVGTFAG